MTVSGADSAATPETHADPGSTDGDSVDAPTELDGRRKRRDRNRDAVVDAMLDLHKEGNLMPSVADIAARSGVSHRSVFRYFDDLDDLFGVAIARSVERFAPLMKIHRFGEGTLDGRIAALVRQRVEFFEAAGPSGRAQRLRAPLSDVLMAELSSTRSFMREQLAHQFAPELSRMSDIEAAATLASMHALTSLESYDLLRIDQGLSMAKTSGALRLALTRMLGA